MAQNEAIHPSSVKPYILVFVGLGILTGLTVFLSYLGLPRHTAILVAGLIALAKCSLIAAFFMHLRLERRGIFFIILVALFFVGVLVVSLIQDLGLAS